MPDIGLGEAGFVDVTAPVVSNTDPLPGQVNILETTNISFDVTDVLGDGVDDATLRVRLRKNGGPWKVCMLNGLEQPGFSGAITPITDGYHVVINPSVDFESLMYVEWDVDVDDLAAIPNHCHYASDFTIRLLDTNTPYIHNQSPGVNASEVPGDTEIYAEIDDDTAGVDGTKSKLYIDRGMGWELVFNAALIPSFQPGFDGPNSTYVADGTGYHLRIDPTDNFAPGLCVRMRGVATDLWPSPPHTCDQEWQFTIAVVPTEEMLQLDMYRFLIWPIREQDQHNGNLFLKRYLLGPQAMWRQTQATIFALKNLWNTTKIPDGLLQYLKNIVGWTDELSYITDGLDALALRRLISASVPLWKNRGTEDTLINVLRLLTSARARYYNWFDLRWIIGETELGEQHQDYDPWLLGEIGGSEFDEYYTNLRIVDDGLDRLLVRNIINLMRPTGERYEVVYLKFLDQFNIAQDTSQWTYNGTPSQLIVEGDVLKMVDDTKEERAIAAVVGATDWADYMATALVVGHSDLAGYGFGLIFDAIDQLNFYAAMLDPLNNQLVLRRRIAGVDGTIATYDFGAVGEELFNDIRYTIRVQAVVEGSATRIQVYVDGVERINITDVTYNHGAMGLIHDMDATLTCEEAELFHLPVDSEIIDINP